MQVHDHTAFIHQSTDTSITETTYTNLETTPFCVKELGEHKADSHKRQSRPYPSQERALSRQITRIACSSHYWRFPNCRAHIKEDGERSSQFQAASLQDESVTESRSWRLRIRYEQFCWNAHPDWHAYGILWCWGSTFRRLFPHLIVYLT